MGHQAKKSPKIPNSEAKPVRPMVVPTGEGRYRHEFFLVYSLVESIFDEKSLQACNIALAIG